jgi:hypothetical protein
MSQKNDILKVEETQHDDTLPQASGYPSHLSLESRIKVERKLKLKLDLRFSILIVIYILNCQ